MPIGPAKAASAKRAKAQKSAAKSQSRTSAKPVKLLAGGNPKIAKGDGDAPVQAYIAAMPGWKRDVGRRLDALIVGTVPDVCKAVKWNTPFYGIEDKVGGGKVGWFLAFHCTTKYIKIAFFRGMSLCPSPPGGIDAEGSAYFHIHKDDQFDEAQFAGWVKQASLLPGQRM